jgi:hypothetical protein
MKADTKKPRKDYPVQTGQESKAMLQALADGKSGRNWQNVDGADSRVHQTEGARHRVQLALTDDERFSGLTPEILEGLTLARDADEDFMLLYITRLLQPSQPMSDSMRTAATVDLDDVIKAVGWKPLSTVERANMRRRVWEFIKFVERAEIHGERSVKYFDKSSGKEIETYISSAPWWIETRTDAKPSLFDKTDEVPLKVTVVASQIWSDLTKNPNTAQFLPMGEVLGAIAPGKPSGAWARTIGLALCDFWRRNPRETRLQPTRRELLEFCTPTTGPVQDVLNGPNPRYVVQYWVGALRILVECDFLADEGEALETVKSQRDGLSRYQWQDTWLDAKVELSPGSAMAVAVEERAKALPKARSFKKPQRKK